MAIIAGGVQVRIDDRARLMGALLAASRYAELSQARKKHGLHAYARALRKRVTPLADHPAVQALNGLFERTATLGELYAPLLELDAETLCMDERAGPGAQSWSAPELWLDFAERAGLRDEWREEAEVWDRSVAETGRVLAGAELDQFLSGYFGPIRKPLVFMPNIGFPADQEVASESRVEYMAIVPPRPAWGDSPPWPFDEDPAYLLRAAVSAFGERLIRAVFADADFPDGAGRAIRVAMAGLSAIYLEDRVSPQEAKAYLLLEKRMHGLDALPSAVQALRGYRDGPQAGTLGALKALLIAFAG